MYIDLDRRFVMVVLSNRVIAMWVIRVQGNIMAWSKPSGLRAMLNLSSLAMGETVGSIHRKSCDVSRRSWATSPREPLSI